MHYLITGANRGIGLELTRQLLGAGHDVHATARAPESADALGSLAGGASGRLHIHSCDVASDTSVAELATALGGAALDVVINNAGIFGEQKGLESLDLDDALRTFAVNALGSLRVTRAVMPMLRRGSRKCLVHISSGLGSIGDNTSGGLYGYRMSKAALNMASRTIALDYKKEGLISVVVNPGWVRTDMGGPGAPLDVATSASNLLAVIGRLRLEDSGAYFNHTGEAYPW